MTKETKENNGGLQKKAEAVKKHLIEAQISTEKAVKSLRDSDKPEMKGRTASTTGEVDSR